jgi:hypothetical protein
MTKRRRKSGDSKVRYVGLHHYMLRSPAWKMLDPNAKAVLIDIWQRHNGTNNGWISYSVREAQEIGLSKDQAARALQTLQDRGFLICTRASAFSVKTRAARLWRTTAEPSDNGQLATKDFMRWSPALMPSHEANTHAPKFKTQSHQRDAQSHPRDCGAELETKEPLTVAYSGTAQSHQRDTSGIPGGYALSGEPCALVEPSLPSLWLGLLASSHEACAIITGASAAASKKFGGASISEIGTAA